MKRRLIFPALVAGSIAIFSIASSAESVSTGGIKRYKIVIQVSDIDPAKWNLALNNAKNLQDDVGATNVDIEIVTYGPGIGMLQIESPTGTRIADAIKAGIQVVACENTMRSQKLAKDDMLPAISYVPAGVTEILRRQSNGWAYLRP